MNTGGEPHSFAEVSSFGTGVVPFLNPALPPGTPPAVPVGGGSLDAANAATIILPGNDKVITGLSVGKHKFQCLIHPWMQLEGGGPQQALRHSERERRGGAWWGREQRWKSVQRLAQP